MTLVPQTTQDHIVSPVTSNKYPAKKSPAVIPNPLAASKTPTVTSIVSLSNNSTTISEFSTMWADEKIPYIADIEAKNQKELQIGKRTKVRPNTALQTAVTKMGLNPQSVTDPMQNLPMRLATPRMLQIKCG